MFVYFPSMWPFLITLSFFLSLVFGLFTKHCDQIWCGFHQHYTSSFCVSRSQKCKRHLWLDCLFALLESSQVKAACKHVGEIDLWWQRRINNLVKSNGVIQKAIYEPCCRVSGLFQSHPKHELIAKTNNHSLMLQIVQLSMEKLLSMDYANM